MIKKPKFTDKGDMVLRRTYVVQAKQSLVQFISQRKNLDARDIEYLLEPTVVTTPEVAFEEHLESWRLPLENKCKEGFLRSIQSMEPLIDMEPPKNLFKEMSVLVGFFDQFWSMDEADLVELEMDTWKTRDCFHSPPESSTIGQKIHINRFDDQNEQWLNSRAQSRFRSAPRSTLQFTIISSGNATSTVAKISNSAAALRWRNGANPQPNYL